MPLLHIAIRYGQLKNNVLMNLSKISISIILLTFIIKVSAQSINYNYANYANNPTTEISAEFLDSKMILETVDNNSKWEGEWTQNSWYNFEFKHSIYINFIEVYLDNPEYKKNYKRNDIAISVKLVDTTFIFKIKQFQNKFLIERESSFLLINQKGTFHHFSEIRILSPSTPIINQTSNNSNLLPRVNLKEEKRVEISESIWGYTIEKSRAEAKYWPKRIKFYKKYIKDKDLQAEHPHTWLFNGKEPGSQYSTRGLSLVMRETLKKT